MHRLVVDLMSGSVPKCPPVRWLRQAVLVCFSVIAAVACSGIKPDSSSIQRPVAPTLESIRDLFDVLQIDAVVGDLIELEEASLNDKLQGMRTKANLTSAQDNILDECIAKAASVVEEEVSVDHVRRALSVTIQQSFSQQDIDAITAYYRTKSGQAVLAQSPHAIRAYFKQKQAARNVSRSSEGDQVLQDPLPQGFGAFLKAWENQGFADFFNSDIGRDIRARLPAATHKFEEEGETLEEKMQTRLWQVKLECQAKMKAAGTK
jgi:hypothetical protein